jgi:uncharacterized metal-binding protein YceD (DUF177 family)
MALTFVPNYHRPFTLFTSVLIRLGYIHVHVQLVKYMYMYTCIRTLVKYMYNIHVHVQLVKYMYMYTCIRTLVKYMYNIHVHVHCICTHGWILQTFAQFPFWERLTRT